jgi:hypothetical protein
VNSIERVSDLAASGWQKPRGDKTACEMYTFNDTDFVIKKFKLLNQMKENSTNNCDFKK